MHSDWEKIIPAITGYIDTSFRNTADRDYISARLAYRYKLEQPFLWSALHSLEKYLKAILLYNGKNAKGLKHDILTAYQRVLTIPEISFDFPPDTEEFIARLNKQGQNRYYEYPYFFLGDELRRLDKTIWHIRRYCWFLHATTILPGNKKKKLFHLNIEKIQNPYIIDNPHCFTGVPNGYLEEVLKGGKKMQEIREQLTYKNYFYGRRKKKKIKLEPLRTAGNPYTFTDPQIIPVLDKLVDFSKPVRKLFKDKGWL